MKTLPAWRVTLSDRLTDPEQFVTLAHELGHIFCGHLGGCLSNPKQSRDFGWPDRCSLGAPEREIEAEAVAWIVAERAALTTQSSGYLSGFKPNADMEKIDWEIIARAASRIEKLGRIAYK